MLHFEIHNPSVFYFTTYAMESIRACNKHHNTESTCFKNCTSCQQVTSILLTMLMMFASGIRALVYDQFV